jgi:hypothetical protein
LWPAQPCYTDCCEKLSHLSPNLRYSGNHDYEGGDSNYFGYFGAKANPDGKRTVTTGLTKRWTVFALNSNIDATAASVQATVAQELASAALCGGGLAPRPVHLGLDGDNTRMTAMCRTSWTRPRPM